MSLLEANIWKKSFAHPGGEDFLSVLSNVEFQIEQGEFVCIVGPSGCGKTTLLQMVAGLDKDFEGEISLDGSPPGKGPRVGYMFQSPRLMPWMSVLDNLRLVASKEAVQKRLPERLLSEFGLEEFIDTYPNRLSGGMQRRAALARAYVVEPKILLLDEPFVSLDAPVANKLRLLLLQQYRQRGATVMFVTHDLREAIFLADRILFLSSRPAQIVLDFKVPQSHPRKTEGPELEAVRSDLLKRYPQLLAGLPGDEDSDRVVTDISDGPTFRA